jgi:4-amino-4-deoxy-L-arabinose transferase-like glycosyltransferase
MSYTVWRAGKNSHFHSTAVKNLASRLLLGLSCCLTILAGCALIPYAGIQMDEALFAGPYYQPVQREFRIRLFHHDIPLMVMTYIGTLKTLVYWPLLALFRSGFEAHPLRAAWVLRFPTVFAGALTVLFFFYLAERSAGRRAALIATPLLASDPTFLLTNTFDWGPVALEHLLLVTGCLFLVKYAQDQAERDLPLGFFFLGLALWNKAVFVWALAGLIGATLSIFWRELSRMITRRHLAVAAAGFLAGSLPFVIYNGHRRAETFRSSAHFEPRRAPAKFLHVRSALGGYGLFGYLVSEEFSDNPKPAVSLRGRAAAFIRDHLGEHRSGGMEYATGLALLAVPFWWRSGAARFSVVFCAVCWFLMASTRDAGASLHHTVLLWPFPQLFVAVVIVSLRSNWLARSISILLVVLNLLVVDQYIVQFERNGAEGPFTDAIYPLSAALSDRLSDHRGQTIYVLDWGIQFPLNILHNGRLHMTSGHDPFLADTPSDWDKGAAARMFADRSGLFIGHHEKRENFTGVRKRFDLALSAAGCLEDPIETIPDSNGRPVFEIFKIACETRNP